MYKILKRIYQLVPFKLQLFLLIKKIYVPKFYRYLPVKGEFKVFWTANDFFKIYCDYNLFMENELFWLGLYGGWEKKSLEVWIKLCKYCYTILDIGANSGIYSLVAQSVNSKAKIYAFEPIYNNVELLHYNRQINNFPIKIIEKAVSDHSGLAKMYALPNTVNYMTSINKNRYKNKKVIEIDVSTISLSEFIEDEEIKKIDLMKIDVEEHEYEVIQGLDPYLKIMIPAFIMEIIGNENGKKIQKLFEANGYLFFLIDEVHDPQRVQSIIDVEHHNYLICLPVLAKKIGLL